VIGRRHLGFLALCAFLLVACAPLDTEPLGDVEQPIINGEVDDVNHAVVALFSDNGACSGTILHVQSGSACIITAAHCFGSGPLKIVVRGTDYDNPEQVLTVSEYKVHPLYNDQDNAYDFAIVKAKFAANNIPQILPMSPQEDFIKVGTTIEHSGYGVTSYPNGSTTIRHRSFGKIGELYATQLAYNQPGSGPCSGDSGGPQLVDTPNGKRVVGVTSYGDQECKSIGVSGRVSSFYKSFILPFCGELPNSGSISSSSSSVATSSSAATSGAGGSEPTSVGVSTTATTAGAGGASAGTTGAGANDLWTAGEVGKTEHTGTVVTTSCAVSSEGPSGSRGLSWTALCALGLLGHRRRSHRSRRRLH